jgi:hypothetical protein
MNAGARGWPIASWPLAVCRPGAAFEGLNRRDAGPAVDLLGVLDCLDQGVADAKSSEAFRMSAETR